jgi:hypothetical protein
VVSTTCFFLAFSKITQINDPYIQGAKVVRVQIPVVGRSIAVTGDPFQSPVILKSSLVPLHALLGLGLKLLNGRSHRLIYLQQVLLLQLQFLLLWLLIFLLRLQSAPVQAFISLFFLS